MKKIKILTLILLVITSVGCKNDNEKENENSGENKVEHKINGHEYVDLGLPSGLKWATYNIGAASPSDYGNYYAWGEIETKSEYTEENCMTYEEEISDISGNPQYDAAVANWGRPWRLPKNSDFQELIDECTWVWTTQNGHDGYKVVGPNGKNIFLPAAGYRNGALLYYAGNIGFYCSGTSSDYDLQYANSLNFESDYHVMDWDYRYGGLSIRPVSD